MNKVFKGLAVAILLFFSQCDPGRVYERNINLENNQWPVSTKPSFTFTIDDASAQYNIYYNIRYSLSYPYYNLYLKYHLKDSTGSKINSELHEVHLMNKQSGKPRGDGVSNIFDLQTLAIKNKKFPEPGEYTIKLEQYMRTDTLNHIMAVGIKVAQPSKNN